MNDLAHQCPSLVSYHILGIISFSSYPTLKIILSTHSTSKTSPYAIFLRLNLFQTLKYSPNKSDSHSGHHAVLHMPSTFLLLPLCSTFIPDISMAPPCSKVTSKEKLFLKRNTPCLLNPQSSMIPHLSFLVSFSQQHLFQLI